MGTLGPEWDLWVGVTPAMEQFVRPFVEPFGANVIVHDKMNGAVEDYSALLMSSTFWAMFPSEHVLVFQLDTVLYYNNMAKFIRAQKPLIGALWCESNEILVDGIVSWKVGNGGLSLRRKSWMLKCIQSDEVQTEYNKLKSKYASRSDPLKADNEDIFFNVCGQLLIATKQERDEIEQLSGEFSIEVPCDNNDFKQSAPMGGHSVWYYTSAKKQENLIAYGREWTLNMDGQAAER